MVLQTWTKIDYQGNPLVYNINPSQLVSDSRKHILHTNPLLSS